MIRKLRRKFIFISASVLAAAMILLTVIVNAANWAGVRREIGQTSEQLSADEDQLRGFLQAGGQNRHEHGHQQETLSDSRYFLAVRDGSRLIVSGDTKEQAQELAEKAMDAQADKGFLGEYYYRKYASAGKTAVLFLDCSARFATVRRLALISAGVCAACILLSVLLMVLFSGMAIAPVLENSRRQKQFITDASHELKTPLSVIRANMDVLSLDLQDNEWVQSTQRQTGMMTRMVNDLVFLTRSDEEIQPVHCTLDLAQLLRDTAEPFVMMKEAKGGRFEAEAPENLTVSGDAKGLERLISVLCDNAVKYTPEQEDIRLYLKAKGNSAVIGTENAPAAPIPPEKLRHLFDRFYRADEARTKGTASSGTGIGLAIAQAVAQGHRGDCRAFMENGKLRIECRIRTDS